MPEITSVTTLMAEPLLRLLLAEAGHEPPRIPPAAGWRAFLAFAAVPAAQADDGTSFQAEVIEEETAEPVVSVIMVRQLTDELEEGKVRTRRVALQYLDPAPDPEDPPLEERNVWAEDFDSLAAFAAHVEALPEFQYAQRHVPEHVALFVEEDAVEE